MASFNFSLITGSLIVLKKISLLILHCSSSGIKNQNIKNELINITKEAHDNEIFGAPTYVINNKIFWGQDRLEFALNEYNKID